MKKKNKLKDIDVKSIKIGKKKNIIMRHKFLFFISVLMFIAIGIMLYVFFSLFVGGNDKYGDRLKGIKTVQISKSETNKHAKEITSKEEVVDSKVRIQWKIIYINIKVNENTSLDRAKEIANEATNLFSEKERKFYDFGYFLSQNKEDGFIVIGTKNSSSDGIVWMKS